MEALVVGLLIVGFILLLRMMRSLRRSYQYKNQEVKEVFEAGDPLQDPLLEEETALILGKRIPLEYISLTIMARKRPITMSMDPRGFKGATIFAALRGSRLRFKPEGFFERVQGEEGQVLFRVLSITEPGIFNELSMNTDYYPGLLLLMTVKGPTDPLFAFDNMLATAKQVTRILGGELCDANRRLLGKDRIEELREQLRAECEIPDFERAAAH